MASKQFAPEYPRDENGWVRFPSDSEYRKEMFPTEVNQHQAKANVFLIQSCIEYVSEPGQLLLDPFGGTGTLMVGALIHRDVMLVEISPEYHRVQQVALEMLEKIAPGVRDHVSLINSPLQVILPIPNCADHIIFSPPYASIMKSKGTDKLTLEKTDYKMAEYTFTSPLNLGLMNDFIWGQEMETVYRKCFATLKPGGTMTVIVKDHMLNRQRVGLSQSAVDACKRVGFTQHFSEWFKWLAPGSVYTHIYRARGWEVVDDEDIIVFRKGV
jgi:DNA modification methylase